MEKSKLGLPVGLFGALIFAMAYFGGYTVLFLLVGYVLIREEDAWLRRTAVKAVLVSVAFSVINLLLIVTANTFASKIGETSLF